MGENRGKQFEAQVRKDFERVADTSVTRLIDPMGGYASVGNICDFIVYHSPRIYFIECKCHYGNTLPIYSNDSKRCYGVITNNQWEGLLEQSQISGVVAGVLVWFIDHQITVFAPISVLKQMRDSGKKSLNVKDLTGCILIDSKVKRVLCEYNFKSFFENA